jgi:hypothetical protein
MNLCVLILIFGGVLSIMSCKDEGTSTGTGDIVFPDSNISYGRHVQPLFDRGCAFSGCHGADTYPERGYSLDTYQNARARAGVIIPYDPSGSLLIQAVEGRAPNVRKMPPNTTPLNQNQINGLRRWILEGAVNN